MKSVGSSPRPPAVYRAQEDLGETRMLLSLTNEGYGF